MLGIGSDFWLHPGFAIDLIFTGRRLTPLWGCGTFLLEAKHGFGVKVATEVSERFLCLIPLAVCPLAGFPLGEAELSLCTESLNSNIWFFSSRPKRPRQNNFSMFPSPKAWNFRGVSVCPG